MSVVTCGVESVVIIGFARWAWKRCTYVGSDDSATWPAASPDEFEPVPRICRMILAIYEADLRSPKCAPSIGRFDLDPDWVVKRVDYEQTQGRCPPYIIYVDHAHKEIVLAIRGLNLVNNSDYKILLDNRLGGKKFDRGYVHNGLLKSAVWVLDRESETLRRLWEENGKEYSMVFAGHSLGSGVAALITILVVENREKFGEIPRNKIRCYALAPARCMSLNLAVKYADVINSVILQDDFLPRTATPLEDIFKSIFCLPCLLFVICLRDTFIPEGRKLRDPRRLYAPGRIYHIVERKFCRCGRFPPEVRTAIPVDGRFEHIVLSSNATSDHGIIWIERESQKAIQKLKEIGAEPGTVMSPPRTKRMERSKTIEQEHKDALERAWSLNIPHASRTAEDESQEADDRSQEPSSAEGQGSQHPKPESSGKPNWDEVVGKLFEKSDTRKLVLKTDPSSSQR